MDLKEIKKIVTFCRKNGVESLKTQDFEFKLHPSHIVEPKQKSKRARDTDNKDPISEAYTAEETLFWSTHDLPMPPQDEAQ